MNVARWPQTGTTLGMCLLAAALLRLAGGRPPVRRHSGRAIYPATPPRARPFDAALREAIHWQQRAVEEATRTQEALKAWDPKAEPDGGPGEGEEWRRQVALDRGGCLRQAIAQAQRAVALARTPHEICRAGVLLAQLDCSLGRHDQELRQAEKIAALEPRSELVLYCLQHAAHCNGLKRLAQQADAALRSLPAESQGAKREIQPSPWHRASTVMDHR